MTLRDATGPQGQRAGTLTPAHPPPRSPRARRAPDHLDATGSRNDLARSARRDAAGSRNDLARSARRASEILIGMLVLVLVLACNTKPEPEGPIRSAEFGVFYGGQVQQRDEIPFELDRTKQTVGLSIEFREPLAAPATVAWEIDMPGTNLRVRDVQGRRGKGRVVKLDQAVVPSGQTHFDQVLPFEPGDSLGVWNIRVRVNDQIVIDRPFEVYSEARRRRAMARLDAGAPL